MKYKRILITGAAGYIGSVLTRLLIAKDYYIKVIDKLRFGGESLLGLLNYDNFEFFHEDIRNVDTLGRILTDIDVVVHLAAIVGDPACSAEPQLAKETNLYATERLYGLSNSHGVKRFIFASTCSNYGKMENSDGFVDESSTLRPVSLYAETKVKSELYLLGQDEKNVCKPVILRFATVYGISPRMRFDLTVNEFTRELVLGRELVVYGEQFWRPYCHVIDLARSIILAIESPEEKVAFDVFNVGDTRENYQKKMIVDELIKIFPTARIKYIHKEEDPRDYRVSFEKIKNKLGFEITKTVPDGIRQIKEAIEKKIISDPYAPKYKNI